MSIHVLDEKAFFRASIPLADQQRLVLLPGPRSVAAGDELYLRNSSGEIAWVADVLTVQSTGGAQAWDKQSEDAEQPYVVAGWLARVHPGTLATGSAHLTAPWVTLNSRTLSRALPWREGGHLVYHHTLHLVESVLTTEEFELAQALGIILEHRSGHWFFPMGDARKRFLVQVRQEPLLCALCGTPIASLEECTQDHRIPSSQGGPDVLGNLQLAHKLCNEVKGNALPEQYPPVFMPPGTEDDRRSYRRPHRRAEGKRALPAPVLTPVAANGAAVAAAAVVAAQALAPAPRAAQSSPQATPSVPVEAAVAEPAAEAEKPAKASSRNTRRKGKAKTTAAKSDKAVKAAEVAEDVPAVQTEAAPAPVKEQAKEQAKGRKTRSAKGRAAAKAVASPTAEVAAAAAEAAAELAPAPSAAGAEMAEAAAAGQASSVSLEGLSAPEEWLHRVQASSWQELAVMATMPDWAARTATLRTMCALRRNQAQRAVTDGVLVTEATGKEGRFSLLTWKDQQILIEEKGSRRQVHQVHMLQGLAPEVYVWWVSEFGRTAPLSVAMALLSLWQSGVPDAEGRVTAKKGSAKLTLRVAEGRLTDCQRASSGTAVA